MPNNQVTAKELSNIEDKLDAHVQAVKEARLEQKVRDAEDKSDQKRLNDKLVNSMEQLTQTVSKINEFQMEINHLDEKVSENKKEILALREKQTTTTRNQTKFEIFMEEYRVVKNVFITLVITGVLGGGYVVKLNIDNKENMSMQMFNAMQTQTEVLRKIYERESTAKTAK